VGSRRAKIFRPTTMCYLRPQLPSFSVSFDASRWPPARKSSHFWLVPSPHHRSQPRCAPPSEPSAARRGDSLAGCADGAGVGGLSARRARGRGLGTAALGTALIIHAARGSFFGCPVGAPGVGSVQEFAFLVRGPVPRLYVETGAPYTVSGSQHRSIASQVSWCSSGRPTHGHTSWRSFARIVFASSICTLSRRLAINFYQPLAPFQAGK
jgi:hypothetical protein